MGYFHYTGNLYPYYGDMNDFRIYDECLSKEQIHQISQGLILHYPLNSGYGNENLVPNLSQYTQLSPYIRKTSAVDGYVWMQGTTFICEPSTTYTIQVKSDGTCVDTHGGSHSASEKAFSIWLYLCNENTSKDPYTGQYDNPICLKNNNYSYEKKGNMYIWKYTTPSTTKYMSMRINGYSNGTDSTSIKFWDFKIEKGKNLTYPVPNEADNLYSKLGYNSTTEYDTSGLGNNGVMVNNIIHTSDTPLYDSSINLQKTNSNYIDLQNTYITNQSTINLWGKVNTFNNYQRFFEFCNALQGATGSHRITLGTYQSTQQLALRIYGGDTGITSLYVNNITTIDTNWHMYSIVFNKTNLKVFIDGTSIVDATMTQELTSMVRQYSYIGKSSYSGDSYFDGNISDFRIYSTALSAEDIKQLYQSKARIDKNGNVYCNQFVEINGEEELLTTQKMTFHQANSQGTITYETKGNEVINIITMDNTISSWKYLFNNAFDKTKIINHKLKLSFKYKTNVSTAYSMAVKMCKGDSTKPQTINIGSITLSTNWQEYNGIITFGNTYDNQGIYIHTGNFCGGNLYIKDLSLKIYENNNKTDFTKKSQIITGELSELDSNKTYVYKNSKIVTNQIIEI